MPDDLQILYVNKQLTHAIMSNGQRMPVTDFLDGDGEYTENRSEAHGVIIGPFEKDGTGWVAVLIEDYPVPVFH